MPCLYSMCRMTQCTSLTLITTLSGVMMRRCHMRPKPRSVTHTVWLETFKRVLISHFSWSVTVHKNSYLERTKLLTLKHYQLYSIHSHHQPVSQILNQLWCRNSLCVFELLFPCLGAGHEAAGELAGGGQLWRGEDFLSSYQNVLHHLTH